MTNLFVSTERFCLLFMDCYRYLCEEILAVHGKLLKLFRLLAKYYSDAIVYLENIDKARMGKVKRESNFLNYRNVYDFINIMSGIVVSKIVNNINFRNNYFVILDSTQDVSNRDVQGYVILNTDVQGEEYAATHVENIYPTCC